MSGMQQDEVYIELRTEDGRFALGGSASYAVGTDLPHGIGSLSWQWDGARLVARTCRYGMRPLFYCSELGRILLSPSITTLLARGAPRDLDETAIGVFARLGSFLGEDTPFRAIKILPPGGTLAWDGALSIARTASEVEPQTMSRSEAVRRYAGLFHAAIAQTAGPRSLVPLSGGRDSRHIAFETQKLGALARCLTLRYHPPKPEDDLAIARQVTAALAVPHEIIPQSGNRLAKGRRATIACNLATNAHYWMVPLADRLAGATGPRAPILDGIGGDVLSNGLFLDAERLGLYREGRLGELADRLIGEEPAPLPCLLDPAAMPFSAARERLIAEFARHRHAPNPIAAFFFWNRTRRCIAPSVFGVLGTHRVHCPYLDPELCDFLLGLPPEHFLDHSFHAETINSAFPQYAALPFEIKRTNNRTSLWHLRLYAAQLMARLHGTPRLLLDRRYCLPRLTQMLATGSVRFHWVAETVAYFTVLEEALTLGAAVASAPIPQPSVEPALPLAS